MPVNRVLQTSFTSGELDPRLLGRVDIDQYHKGVQSAVNVLAIPHGGLSKRIGTKFISNIPEGEKRMIRFEFNIVQTYLMVLLPGKLYIYKDGVLQTNITANGSATTNDYLVVPWTKPGEVDYVQSADTLIIVHNGTQVQRITRGNSDSTWNISPVTIGTSATFDFRDIDYGPFDFTVTDGGNFGSQTLTCTGDVFTAEHVGGSFRSSEGFSRITAFTNAKTVTINVIKDLDSAFSANDVKFSGQNVGLEQPAFTTSKGFPKSVVFHEGRLWYGGTTSLPQTMWGSVVGDFFNFELGEGLADEAIQFTIDSDQVNAIQYLVSESKLQIFTSGGEFFVKTTQDGPVTPGDFSATRIDTFGSKEGVKPLIVDAQTMYVNKDDELIRSLYYEFSNDNYKSDLTSLLAPQTLLRPVDIEGFNKFGNEEGHYLLVVNEDGTIAVLSILNAERIKSWTRLQLPEGLTAKHIREVENVVYIVVSGLQSGTDSLIAFEYGTFTDANVTYVDAGTTITGLDHLNGHTVRVVGDGVLFPDVEVSGGTITVQRATSTLEVGLGYDINIQTMPSAVSDGLGPAPLEIKRISQVEMLLDEGTRGVHVNGVRIPDRKFGEGILGQPPIGGAVVRRTQVLGYQRLASINISQSDPLNFLLLSLTLWCQV